MSVERRRQRSDYKDQALNLWLKSVAQRTHLVGMVLADRSGFLVASSMSRTYSDEVAARAPHLIQRDMQLDSPTGRPVSVHEMVLGDEVLYLCAVGKRQAARDNFVVAEGGVRRILDIN